MTVARSCVLMRLWQTAENSDLLKRSDLRIGDGISSSRGREIRK